MQKHLILFRGLPSSGKSTLADMLCDCFFEADQFFYDEHGNYNWDRNMLHVAHKTCLQNTENAILSGDVNTIGVSNTFTTEKEILPYQLLAEKYGCLFSTVIVEKRHTGENSHNVPTQTIENMKKRFSIKLN